MDPQSDLSALSPIVMSQLYTLFVVKFVCQNWVVVVVGVKSILEMQRFRQSLFLLLLR